MITSGKSCMFSLSISKIISRVFCLSSGNFHIIQLLPSPITPVSVKLLAWKNFQQADCSDYRKKLHKYGINKELTNEKIY